MGVEEDLEMSALFPTFTIWAKKLVKALSLDVGEAIARDNARYQTELDSVGLGHFNPMG